MRPGELKHGPIALIDYAMPVIVLAPPDASLEKTVSNLQEVAARGGHLILIGSPQAREAAAAELAGFIEMPESVAGRLRRSSSTPCRCSCSPITSRSSWAKTSISRAIWPRA